MWQDEVETYQHNLRKDNGPQLHTRIYLVDTDQIDLIQGEFDPADVPTKWNPHKQNRFLSDLHLKWLSDLKRQPSVIMSTIIGFLKDLFSESSGLRINPVIVLIGHMIVSSHETRI